MAFWETCVLTEAKGVGWPLVLIGQMCRRQKNYVKGFVFGADADKGCKVSPGRLGLVWSSPGRGSASALEGGSRVPADFVI